MTVAPGCPLWVELLSSDPERSIAFYRELLGWDPLRGADARDDSVVFRSDGAEVAGLVPEHGGRDCWLVHLATAGAIDTAAAITAAGGHVVLEPEADPGFGTTLRAVEPTGAVFAAWQPDENTGFEAFGRPGAPTWFELHTPDHATAVRFHEEAFGTATATMSDDESFRYTQLLDGDRIVGGIFGVSPEAPARWLLYVQVEDVDATVAEAVRLGGAVVRSTQDSPFGRLATITDATGAELVVISRADG